MGRVKNSRLSKEVAFTVQCYLLIEETWLASYVLDVDDCSLCPRIKLGRIKLERNLNKCGLFLSNKVTANRFSWLFFVDPYVPSRLSLVVNGPKPHAVEWLGSVLVVKETPNCNFLIQAAC